MPINNIIVISDLHAGCRLGLCPPTPIKLDDGGTYKSSKLQRKTWKMWLEFGEEWVPRVTKKEKYIVVINGDTLDGVHHRAVTQISHNLKDQKRIAIAILRPFLSLPNCVGFYMIRGTSAHVGESGQNEEDLAEELGAIPDSEGRFARWELWYRFKPHGGLCHFTHHIGVTGRTHYETSAVMAELSEMYTDAGRNRKDPPDVVCRSHRHRHIEVRVPTKIGYGIAFTTAGFQLRTPFVYKTAGGRVTTPQIGGSLIRIGDQDLFTRHKIWDIERTKEESL